MGHVVVQNWACSCTEFHGELLKADIRVKCSILHFGLLPDLSCFCTSCDIQRRQRLVVAVGGYGGSEDPTCKHQTYRHVVLPIIAPSLIGVALFGFTLSYDEFARTLLTAGSYNTLPLEIYGMTTNVTSPVLYALGTLTTLFSLLIIGVFLALALVSKRRKARAGNDAGKAV